MKGNKIWLNPLHLYSVAMRFFGSEEFLDVPPASY